ncbi:MAG: anthranilate synthase component I [Fidelibacterota bacterium]
MEKDEFLQLAEKYRTVPVYQRVLADLITPVSTYMSLQRDFPYAFILESVEKGKQYSRYSYVGFNPKLVLEYRAGITTVHSAEGKENKNEPFLSLLRSTMANYSTPKLPGLPSFSGGLVGYFGYETITLVEDVPIRSQGDNGVPEALFMLFEELIAFDHLKGQLVIFFNVSLDENTDLDDAFAHAHECIDTTRKRLQTNIHSQTPVKVEQSKLYSNFTKSQFSTAVKKAKDYITAGDAFQIVLSQRFHRHTSVKPIILYRALRTVNPSPYMFHLKLNDFDIIGASPELLVKVTDDLVEVRPIAGTRSRGKTPEEDIVIAKELLTDEKEKAEHLMLLDLGRNDVGRVAEFGSVHVDEYMVVENYSHVMHIVSDVKGKLNGKHDALDALMNAFPAGTTTGAPKIRAMEIIYELEPTHRGIYSGAVGYLDFCGDLNTCIAIRTMIMKDGLVFFQSGAGIVYDSDPQKEYEETVSKAEAIMSAIDFSERGLIS